MENTTKNRILQEALAYFAECGYSGSNLRDLAARLELSKSALYRHFKSKEDIWNAVLDMMENYYNARFGSEENMPPAPESSEELASLTLGMLNFTLHDANIIMTRRVLLTEQFHDARACSFATRHFFDGTKNIFMKVFKEMMEKGIIRQEDPEMLAFVFTAPITSLVHLCDREPEREAEILQKAETFIRHFLKIYGTADTPSLPKPSV